MWTLAWHLWPHGLAAKFYKTEKNSHNKRQCSINIIYNCHRSSTQNAHGVVSHYTLRKCSIAVDIQAYWINSIRMKEFETDPALDNQILRTRHLAKNNGNNTSHNQNKKNKIIKENILDTNITRCFCKYNIFSYIWWSHVRLTGKSLYKFENLFCFWEIWVIQIYGDVISYANKHAVCVNKL